MLSFGENHDPPLVRLPRAGMVRRGRRCELEASHDDPLEREAAAGPLELPEPTPRPPCSVALEDIEVDADEMGEFACEPSATSPAPRARCAAACATTSSRPGKLNCPPHWHAAEHELFVVLDGGGTLRLYDSQGELAEEHPLRAGPLRLAPGGHRASPTCSAPARRA